MSVVTGSTTVTVQSQRYRIARGAATISALVLLANGAISAVADSATLDDHGSGLGALSEITAGASFVAAAVAIALLRPVSGWRGALWSLAPFGLAVAGVTMLVVPVFGEPSDWLFVIAVLPTFVGMIVAGVVGSGRVWRWWTGVGVALFLPMMFTVPLNSLLMALVMVGVASSTRRRPA